MIVVPHLILDFSSFEQGGRSPNAVFAFQSALNPHSQTRLNRQYLGLSIFSLSELGDSN